VIIVPLFRERI